MAFSVTVGGTNVTAYVREFSIEKTYSERRTATFRLMPPAALVGRLDEVAIYDTDGTTKLFGGRVVDRDVHGLIDTDANLVQDLHCSDWSFYADVALITLDQTTAAPLSDIMAAIVTALSGTGITLDAAQTDSAADIQPFSWENKTVKEALDELGRFAGNGGAAWIWRVSPDQKLRMLEPGTESAPVSISDATPNCRSFEWSDVTDLPIDHVVVVCGATFVGSGALVSKDFVADGVQTTFVGDIAADETIDVNGVMGGLDMLLVNGLTVEPITAPYSWDPATHTLTATGPLTVGTTVYFQYPGVFPFTVEVDDGSPTLTQRFTLPDTIVYAQAVAAANAYLAQLNADKQEATFVTLTGGWEPGQSLSVSLTGRGLSGTHIVRTVHTEFVTETSRIYTITTVSA